MRSIKEIFKSYGILDHNGKHTNGCDKETNHSYGEAYEKILSYNSPMDDPTDSVKLKYPYSFRNDIKLMMEVGVADGSSLLAWRDIFPNAHCVGMDIHPAALWTGQSRTEFYLGDQCSNEDCERAAAGREFDFIVEDATHDLANTLLTFLYLWPFVKPGGLYVVEEFANVGALRGNIKDMWPNVNIVDSIGPFGGIEPLVVFRKSL